MLKELAYCLINPWRFRNFVQYTITSIISWHGTWVEYQWSRKKKKRTQGQFMKHVNKKHLGTDNATVNQQELIRILPQTPIRLAEQTYNFDIQNVSTMVLSTIHHLESKLFHDNHFSYLTKMETIFIWPWKGFMILKPA